MNKVLALINHCSASKDHPDVRDWDAIRRYHVDVREYTDIGYHYGVESVNGVYEVLVGRPEWMVGAHCRVGGMNNKSLGICACGGDPFEGFSDKYPLPPEQLEVWVNLNAELCIKHGLSEDQVYFHRQYNRNKTCPGIGLDIRSFRGAVGARVAEITLISKGIHEEVGKESAVKSLIAARESIDKAMDFLRGI